ncbi:hypothetical protein BDU57DRAFT_522346 [Ampelomyces quisqualis]|uniref:Uncharacterized protein n=1 Tax=Ampelomyces quisqualis TaxID=50730 RepID=A0A6A5QCY9_AMPQU|nr:hypothetical protein BDU57DRAFT_522346 [Ampelomyces quisqualis]
MQRVTNESPVMSTHFPTRPEFDAILQELRTKYDAKNQELAQLPDAEILQHLVYKAALGKDWDRLVAQRKELKDDIDKIKGEARSVLGDFLERTLGEYQNEKNNLLPKYDWPEGVWEDCQTRLDSFCMEKDMPLHQTRRKSTEELNDTNLDAVAGC